MNTADLTLESRITLMGTKLIQCQCDEQRREIWKQYVELINQRSPERVREREKGITR